MQFRAAAHAAHNLSESCIKIVSGRSQQVSLCGANVAARQFWQVAKGQWRQASSNNKFQADHAAFGGIALDSAASVESSGKMLLNEPGNEPRTPIASAQNKGSGVASWRNDVGADMVGMLAELTGTCGRAYILGAPPGGEDFAFQVTTRSCAVGNLSYAHEHGHNMSMLHNFCDATGSAFPYGVGHLVEGVFRTVMNTQSGERRPYFSNPNVSFMGNPTGIANARDNARVGTITAPSIAQFRGVANLIFSSSFE